MSSASGVPQVEVLKRHEDLWFADGNILLSAVSIPGTERGRWKTVKTTERREVKTVKMFFRVHKSILSRHSDVFRDMFDSPAVRGDVLDAKDVGKLNGDDKDFASLPHVVLHDSAEEVSAFLKTIYEPWRVIFI